VDRIRLSLPMDRPLALPVFPAFVCIPYQNIETQQCNSPVPLLLRCGGDGCGHHVSDFWTDVPRAQGLYRCISVGGRVLLFRDALY